MGRRVSGRRVGEMTGGEKAGRLWGFSLFAAFGRRSRCLFIFRT